VGSNKENGITQRIFLWGHAKEIIKQHPVIGVGTGDVNAALDEQYKNLLESNKDFPPSMVRAIKSFSLNKFNAHNQFLQTAMAIGLLGLIVFLINIGISISHAYREKQYLFLSFLALFVLSCFSESLLERQWGIVFFSFLNSLFVFNYSSPPENSR
jgi:O-antigen ligase